MKRQANIPVRTAYSPREVSDRTGMPYKRVLRMMREGRLRFISTGRHYMIPVAALDEFLASAS